MPILSPTLLQDLRYALRQLVKSPGFTITAVLSLALGIGATTAVFSVLYAALIRPYPFREADRIMRLTVMDTGGHHRWINLSGPQIRELRQSPAVDSVVAMDTWSMPLTGGELPEDVNAIQLSANGWDFLGVPALRGRGLQPSDAPEGETPQPVVVLGYRFWVRHFASDPAVLGRTLQLDHKNYLVIGIAAPRFRWYSADLYVPANITGDPANLFIVNFRLKPGETREAANAALQPLLEQFAREYPKRFPAHFKVHVQGLNDWVVRDIGHTLYMLLAAVALLLVIGCGNVSILLLARGEARRQELAVRAAIGARRGRIIRQLLTESLLIAITGAALGIALTFAMLAGIRLILPPFAFAPEAVVEINPWILGFSIAVALVTGILFGLWPAWQLSRPDTAQMMQSNSRRMAGSLHGRRTHQGLIAGQIALTLLLLASAGAAMQEFARLLHAPLGYDPHNVLLVSVPLHENAWKTWPERSAYLEQLRTAVAQAPGVTAAIAPGVPPNGGWEMRFEIQGRTAPEQQNLSLSPVSPDYFAVLRIPLLQGRLWTPVENRNAAPVAVINRTLADMYFPNGDAIGKSIKLPMIDNRPPIQISAPGIENAWFQIIGIVADSRNNGLREAVRPGAFVPWTVHMSEWTQILVRSDTAPLPLLLEVRKRLATVNADQPGGSEAETLEQRLIDEPEWQQEHLISWVFSALSLLALVLAAVGLFSVVSYSVTQRTSEFGIRMALGAQPSHVLRIVFSSMLVNVGIGILAGLVMILALGRVLAAWQAGNAHDPLVLLLAVALLIAVAVLACVAPARRAANLQPMIALRCD
ncbi:ABC transporter permease [Acidobacteria bacterium AB60]|nr:ABC transporter permease [Acidobacteria bacterium AB60]